MDVFLVFLLLNLNKCLVNTLYRSSLLQMFHKIDVLKDFIKFTGRHQRSSFFLKKETPTKVSSVKSEKFFRKPFLKNTSRRMLLPMCNYQFRVNIQDTTRISMNVFTMSLLLILNRFGPLTLF